MNALSKTEGQGRALKPHEEIQLFISQRASEFKAALPAHITPDKFQRTILTAIASNPQLIEANRRSFWNSIMKCAQDGLLPDGREAAFVVFTVNAGNFNAPKWEKHVQYMPMAYGLRKKILQSGEIADITTAVVYRQEYDNGRFSYEEGTNRHLMHKPDLTADVSDDDIVAAYSVATLKDGSKSFEVMSRREIDRVRQKSQTGAVGKTDKNGKPIQAKGPWAEWYSEMARKSVMRRHSKYLPMSSDIADVEATDMMEAAQTSAQIMSLPQNSEPLSITKIDDDIPSFDVRDHPSGAENPSVDNGEVVPVVDDPEASTTAGDEGGDVVQAVVANNIMAEYDAAVTIVDLNRVSERHNHNIQALREGLKEAVIDHGKARAEQLRAGK